MVDMGDDGEIADVVEGRAHGARLAGAGGPGKRQAAARTKGAARCPASRTAVAGAGGAGAFRLFRVFREKSINFNQVR
jgi:hypothetical protein